jgi:glyoxylase-like metal-dependent hydrolase (beta-lactamase superfamily II)
VVVEAPYTEAQSKTLIGALLMKFPGKPVRFAAVTHTHFDHVGGVRGMAAAGATILAASGHERPLRELLRGRHTNPADDLETRRATGARIGSLVVYDDRKVISEDGQTLELHAIAGSPHADPIVLAYVPALRLLFQSDLYFPATRAPGTNAAVHLFDSVRRLGLDVSLHAGGHGGVGPFDEMVQAVEAAR